MALATFTPSASTLKQVTMQSANVALPGSSTTTVILTNLGNSTVWVVLGTTNAVTASVGTGLPILPKASYAIAQGANTWIAFISSDSHGSVLGINTGS